MAVNFTKHQEEISNAWRQVTDSKNVENWALFGYEGNTNIIKLMLSGSNGLRGLVSELNCSLIQYAFCRVIDRNSGLNKLILINWQGESSPLSRKGLCASHVGDVVNYFKGCSQTITIRNDDEANPEYLMEQINKSSASRMNLPRQVDPSSINDSPIVGSTYKKTDIKTEIAADRKSFWKRQEEEEKERLVEEKKRAAEKQALFERERKLREESEAKKLAETIKERDRVIEATRQADRRASSSNQPSSTTSQSNEQKDDEDDERVGRRSELIRLERNQETLSLISKGLIKNKRAIFEQVSQQQRSSPPPSNNMARRSSGTVITQRLNTFQSLEPAESQPVVDKLANGIAKQVVVSEKSEGGGKTVTTTTTTVTMTQDAEPIKSEPHVHEQEVTKAVEPAQITPAKNPDPLTQKVTESMTKTVVENGSHLVNGDLKDTNGNNGINNNNDMPMKSPKQELKLEAAQATTINGDFGIAAKALYDYQAVDATEISFDPDDLIGYIKKVDPGWWQGSVITGTYKGQTGLFPSNYVEELP